MYPLWLNIMSAITLIAILIGVIVVFFNQTIGFLILALGFFGVAIFGNIANRIKRRANRDFRE